LGVLFHMNIILVGAYSFGNGNFRIISVICNAEMIFKFYYSVVNFFPS
jgi:hypothetical protein